MEDYVKKSMLWTGGLSLLSLIGFIIAWTSWYIVPEGI